MNGSSTRKLEYNRVCVDLQRFIPNSPQIQKFIKYIRAQYESSMLLAENVLKTDMPSCKVQNDSNAP